MEGPRNLYIEYLFPVSTQEQRSDWHLFFQFPTCSVELGGGLSGKVAQ